MEKAKIPYLVIGAGRAASHLMHYFDLKGIDYINWNRKEHSFQALDECLTQVSDVLLLIRDSAIKEFRDAHLKDFKGVVAHFSGSLNVDGIASFHPLMTFGPEFYDLPFYEKIHFAAASKETFRGLFPQLPNPVFEMKASDKPLYHALCVMSGNFPQILWQSCLARFDELGVPKDAVALYLQKNLENFMEHPGQSLTGPLARNDQITIETNLKALPVRLRSLYEAFVTFFAKD
ncbi:MAG: DUF2520 domain-containing protein [Alphaproteobacteria bacterium]|nr:DUF2520 domain-containing protein [Alphaproteobacteria bacterium]